MRKLLFIAVLVFFAISFTPRRKKFQEKLYVHVKPNETAFVIPLEGANKTNQGKFDSESYLQEKKVAAKKIEIPTRWHATERYARDGKWVPMAIVIKVDRTPVTREWTDGSGGSAKHNQAMKVESKGSIAFSIGATSSATILESDAAKFLFFHNGRTLASVMDMNIRPYVQDQLGKQFAEYDLATARTKKNEIFNKTFKATEAFFKDQGVTVQYVGVAGGVKYEDIAIQTAINENFTSAMKLKNAENAVKAAKKFATARAAIEANQMLEAKIKWMTACSSAMESGKYPVPATYLGKGNPADVARLSLSK